MLHRQKAKKYRDKTRGSKETKSSKQRYIYVSLYWKLGSQGVEGAILFEEIWRIIEGTEMTGWKQCMSPLAFTWQKLFMKEVSLRGIHGTDCSDCVHCFQVCLGWKLKFSDHHSHWSGAPSQMMKWGKKLFTKISHFKKQDVLKWLPSKSKTQHVT